MLLALKRDFFETCRARPPNSAGNSCLLGKYTKLTAGPLGPMKGLLYTTYCVFAF